MSNQRLLIATNNPGKMREYAGLFRDEPFELLSLADLGISHEVDEMGLTFRENAWLKASEYAALAGILTLADDSGLEVDALGGEPGVKSARYGGEAYRTDQDRVALLLRNLEGVPWEKRTARFRCVIDIVDPSGAERGEIPPTPLYERGVTAGSAAETETQTPRSESVWPPPLQRGVRGDFRPRTQPTAENADGGLARGPTLLASVVGSVAGMIQYTPEGDDGFGYDPVFNLPSFGKTIAQLSLDDKNRISHRADAAAKALRKLSAMGPVPKN